MSTSAPYRRLPDELGELPDYREKIASAEAEHVFLALLAAVPTGDNAFTLPGVISDAFEDRLRHYCPRLSQAAFSRGLDELADAGLIFRDSRRCLVVPMLLVHSATRPQGSRQIAGAQARVARLNATPETKRAILDLLLKPDTHGIGIGKVSDTHRMGPVLEQEHEHEPRTHFAPSLSALVPPELGTVLFLAKGREPATLAALLSSKRLKALSTALSGEAFKRINVAEELARAGAWSLANPAKAKTAAGLPRFIVAWLSRAEPKPTPAPVAKPYRPECENLLEKVAQS